MKPHMPAVGRRPFTAEHGNAIGCRPISSEQPDGTWITRYPCALVHVGSLTAELTRRQLNDEPARCVSDSSDAHGHHPTLDAEIAATTDEQLKLALRSLTHHRKHLVQQALRRTRNL